MLNTLLNNLKKVLVLATLVVLGLLSSHLPYGFSAGTASADLAATVTISTGAGSSPNCSQEMNCFNPSSLTVQPGTTVTWQNHDKVSHTVTSGNPSDNQTGTVFDSSLIAAGKSFSFTFNTPGTYNYFCQVHPWMTGKVIVASGSSKSTSATSQTPNVSQQPTPQPYTSQAQSTPITEQHIPNIVSTYSAQSSQTVTPATSNTNKIEIRTGVAEFTSCQQTNSCFNPSILYATPGTTITWQNNDTSSHEVMYGTPGSFSSLEIFDSGTIAPEQSFTFQFNHPGIYPYYDKSYPWEIGVVYVKES